MSSAAARLRKEAIVRVLLPETLAQAARPLAGGSPGVARASEQPNTRQRWGLRPQSSTKCQRTACSHRSYGAQCKARGSSGGQSGRCSVSAGQKCGLTLRSSGPPPAWHLAREAMQGIIRLAGQAPRRWCPLSSNVRPHVNTSKATVVTVASVRGTAECRSLQRPRLAGQSNQTQGFCSGTAASCAKVLSGSALRLPRPHIKPTLNGQFVEPPDGGGTPCSRSALAGQLHQAAGHARGWSIGGARLWRGPAACASFGSQVRSNPSLERTSTGLALGPRGFSGYRPPRGPSANPAGSAQLKR